MGEYQELPQNRKQTQDIYAEVKTTIHFPSNTTNQANNGKYKIAPRGSFDGDQALWATEFLECNYDLSIFGQLVIKNQASKRSCRFSNNQRAFKKCKTGYFHTVPCLS